MGMSQTTCVKKFLLTETDRVILHAENTNFRGRAELGRISNILNPWVQFLVPQKPDIVLCACNPSTQKVESVGPEVQDHPQLRDKFKASLGYTRLCLRNSNININLSFVTMINTSDIKRIALSLCLNFPGWVCWQASRLLLCPILSLQSSLLRVQTNPHPCSFIPLWKSPLFRHHYLCAHVVEIRYKEEFTVLSAHGSASLCEDAVCDSLGAQPFSF